MLFRRLAGQGSYVRLVIEGEWGAASKRSYETGFAMQGFLLRPLNQIKSQ